MGGKRGTVVLEIKGHSRSEEQGKVCSCWAWDRDVGSRGSPRPALNRACWPGAPHSMSINPNPCNVDKHCHVDFSIPSTKDANGRITV